MHDIGIVTKITLFNSNGKAVLLYASESLTFTHSTQATSFQKEMSTQRKLSDTCRSFVYSSTLMIAQRVLYRLHGWFEISRSIMDNIIGQSD